MNGHTEDKPKDCRYCYFWKQTEGCTFRGKTGCYYVSAQKPPAAVSECDGCPYGRASPCIGWCTKELLRSMHISYQPLWNTLKERGMRKEDLRLAAGLTTNMIANMGKGKNISMETLVRICEALNCGIMNVIKLEQDNI